VRNISLNKSILWDKAILLYMGLSDKQATTELSLLGIGATNQTKQPLQDRQRDLDVTSMERRLELS